MALVAKEVATDVKRERKVRGGRDCAHVPKGQEPERRKIFRRVDARILAHYGVERRPPLRPQLAAEVRELDSLLKRRLDLEQTLQKEKTRLSEMQLTESIGLLLVGTRNMGECYLNYDIHLGSFPFYS